MTDTAATPHTDARVDERPDLHDVVLCIDLDGTLIRSDLRPNRARARAPASCDPLRDAVLAAARPGAPRSARSRPRDDRRARCPTRSASSRLVRARARRRPAASCSRTASDRKFADAVAAHLGCSTRSLATDGGAQPVRPQARRAQLVRTLRRARLRLRRQRARRPAGLAPARAARSSSTPSRAARAPAHREVTSVALRCAAPRPRCGPLRAMRLHQWLKNLLLFLPMLTAHRAATRRAAARIAGLRRLQPVRFSVYLINDLLDSTRTARHPRKRLRPFASGDIAAAARPRLWRRCCCGGIRARPGVSPLFSAVLAGYFVLTLAYSFGSSGC